MFNLLEEQLIRVRLVDQSTVELGLLPSVLAWLAAERVVSFPALRAHQRFPWHAFLVQLAALALHRAGRTEPPATAATWAELLRGLTPGYANDEPWCLVVEDASRPALLQAPVPDGDLGGFKPVPTPDALDMLVTSRNHDLKRRVMAYAEADDWLFALTTVQTMDGGLSGSYRGIARMNSDYGSRPCVGIRPCGGPGEWFKRDLRALLHRRQQIVQLHGFPHSDGEALLWLKEWNGNGPIHQPAHLDPFFIEICRRVRLIFKDGSINALKTVNKSLIGDGFEGGITGDPWAPINTTEGKIFTISKQKALGYEQIIELLNPKIYRAAPLQSIDDGDPEQSLIIQAAAMVRGSGKTQGYHERSIMTTRKIKHLLSFGDADKVAAAGHERADQIAKLSNQVLRPALYCLLKDRLLKDENGTKDVSPQQRGQADRWIKRLDRIADADFFERLWEEFETDDPDERRRIRDAWLRELIERAEEILHEACEAVPLASIHRYRARTRALGLFHYLARKKVFPQLYEDQQHGQPEPVA